MAAFLDFLDNLRYDRPGLFALLVLAGVGLLLAAMFMAFPATPAARAIGVTTLQERVRAVANAGYWGARALLNRSGDETPQRRFGNIEGVDPKGSVIVTQVEGAEWVQRLYGVADAQLTDLAGAARVLSAYRTENARLDIYPGDQAVLWVRGVPVNVKLIEAGVARPDPNPPTNIVDLAFATYYWRIAKGTPPKD